jgi:hypothetical protein
MQGREFDIPRLRCLLYDILSTMTPEIIRKLNEFLDTHVPFKEECEAVYLMVEVRKLLDREHRINRRRDQFLKIWFYCDWTVHVSKDQNQADIEEIMVKFNNLEGINSFFSFSELRKEMSELFSTHGLRTKLCEDDDHWKHFVDVFIQVLADQPITKPFSDISSVSFLPGNKETKKVTVKFTDKRIPPIAIAIGE